MSILRLCLMLLVSAALAHLGVAAHAATGEPPDRNAAPEGPTPTVRHNQVTLRDGTSLAYRVTATLLPLIEEPEQTIGQVFHVTYEREDPAGAAPARTAPRPITFVFNGGPGAASAFLHLGALGPRRIRFDAEGGIVPPPVRLADNPLTWLAFTDLVFVDPIGTGYSRSAAKRDGEQPPGRRFWGVRQDLQALEDFLRRYLSRHQRWSSPRFLAGESYGGFRVAAFARHLAQEGIDLNGVILISPVLEFLALRGGDLALIPAVTLLPSLAATAITHGRAPPPPADGAAGDDPRRALAAVEHFALTDYLTGLAAGSALPDDARDAFYRRVAEVTGLPLPVVQRTRGRIGAATFARELLRPQERLVGLYDGTMVLPDPDPGESGSPDELSLLRIKAPFLTAAGQYLRSELGYESDLPYELLNPDVFRNWDWSSGIGSNQGYAGTSQDLETALAIHPGMRVMVAHGVHDLVTPYFGTLYVLQQLHLPRSVAEQVSFHVYPGGHMFYTRDRSLAAFAEAADAFYRRAVPALE